MCYLKGYNIELSATIIMSEIFSDLVQEGEIVGG